MTGVLTDSLSGKTIGAQRILLTDSLGEVIKITRSNNDGKFRFTDVSSKHQLYLRLDRSSESVGNAVIRDLNIAGSVEKEVVHVENIYFDFDHYRIRPEASRVLDELADHLIKHPGVQVEIFAFADDRGTNDYNLKLTQKRGQSVVEYLAKKGVDQTGLAIVAKGKQEQKEVDVELQRQYNRRVEFYLNGNSDPFAETSRTYILKKKADWSALSQVTGVSKDELKLLNAATIEEVQAFQPVRVPLRVKLKSNDLLFSAN